MGLWDCHIFILQYHSPAVYTVGLWDYPAVILQSYAHGVKIL